MILFYLIIFLSTFFSIYHLISSYKFLDKKVLHRIDQKGISILIPCYNEAPILKYTIEGLLNINYDNMEIIFINDGSKDNTLDILNEILDLQISENNVDILPSNKVKGIYKSNKYHFINVIDKYNSGKADSLNIGISYAHKELIVTMDGDCILEKNALININTTFDDENVIAAGGVVHIMQIFKLDNKPPLIVLMQALDYIKGFYIYKTSLAYNDALSIISGAFGAFKKDIVVEIGGFKPCLGEDIDITLRLQNYAKKHNKKIVFNKKAICYSECPESLRELIGQRIRWQKGFIQGILNNRNFLFKNVFKSNVSFYIIVDAILNNSFSSIVFIINIILVLTKIIHGYPMYILTYYLSTILFNIFSSIIAIKEAKKNTHLLRTTPLYTMITLDIMFFQFLRIFFFLAGTITYYFNNKNWYKVSRTNNSYTV
ncbi:glycosyltransferase [Caloranaerobacter ferrireducens]|uniref:glycosyltransferase n=1 Tax=Caloranaerobacter ferrireducens TaxID=1323370 RepID=UPI00084CECA0|nr:glycosyltransferase family 2 protein [Caloranaerobacter ferrireducens]